jgi:hypothetical protein
MTRRIVASLCTLALTAPAFAQENYEGGKGLLTLEGPSGMFINPTSATMPAGYSTLQYCVFFPNNETDVVGHGLMGSYGITDALEIGAAGNYVDLRAAGDELTGGGPFARFRLRKDEAGGLPQVSVGAYSRLGDDALHKIGAFSAAYKRLPIAEDGPVKAVGLHAGVKHLWLDSDLPEDTSLTGYGGVEVQLPLRCYAVGEVSTKDDDQHKHTPYAYGIQWRAAGIAMSFAGIQDGNLDEASFFYGIGFGGKL